MSGGEYYSEGYKAGQRDAYELTYFHTESCLGRAAAELSPAEFEIVNTYLNDLLAILERRLSK